MMNFKKISIVVIILFSFGIKCSLHAQDLVVGSYNIRYENQSDAEKGNGWKNRCPVITQLIKFNDFDILGMQEVLDGQLEDLLKEMSEYDYVGVGRDDGKKKGEYAPILYKKERFSSLQSGVFWLSEQTDFPNKGWDAALPRICTWIELFDKKTNDTICFFNLHMDHIGVEARKESAKLVLKKINEISKKHAVILTGDFNVDQTNESYYLLANSKILSDSYEKATVCYALNGTFNNFNPNLVTDSRIDHVFVSNHFAVDRYGILTDSYRSLETGKETSEEAKIRLPSDHYPVKVILSYQNKLLLQIATLITDFLSSCK